MYVGDWPCDYVDHERGFFTYAGLGDDTNWYACGADLLGHHNGAAAYPCPWASAGDWTWTSSYVEYEDDIILILQPIVMFMILS